MTKLNLNSKSFEDAAIKINFDSFMFQYNKDLIASTLNEQELDSTLKTELNSLRYAKMTTLFRAVQRLNAWFEFFMDYDSYKELIESVMPLIFDKKFNSAIQVFAEQMIKLTKSYMKPYLAIASDMIKFRDYNTLELIDSLIMLYQKDKNLELKKVK